MEFPLYLDDRGNLSFLQNSDQIPFDIKRTYWVYDVPGGSEREGHAYRQSQEVIIALSGSLDVVVEDTTSAKKVFKLNRSSIGLFVPAGLWRTINNFSTNAFELVLTSTHFDPDDYIRSYNEFINIR